LGHTKDLKNGICCFSCFNAQILRVAQRIKKQSVNYTSAKEKLIQPWRYKTLAVVKRHKTTYLYLLSIFSALQYSKAVSHTMKSLKALILLQEK